MGVSLLDGWLPWTLLLLGAAGVDQLHANLRADAVTLTESDLAELDPAAIAPADYWAQRSDLAWH